MANTFTATRAWRYGGGSQKSLLSVEGVLTIDTTASGGAAPDDLPAALFGLKQIIGIAVAVNDGETKIYMGCPDYTGDSLLITDGSAAGAIADLPDDIYKLSIQGYA